MSAAGAPVESEMDRFFHRDQMLPKVTAEAVADALHGFPLQCRYSMDWLATAVRRALAITIRAAGDRPDRQSNRKTKKELETLASRAAKAWLSIQERSYSADSALFDFAFRNWHGEGALSDDDQSDWASLTAALAHLDWLSLFLRDASKAIEKQKPRWPEAEARQIRIERAEYLAPIYKTAFGLDELIRFADFYQLMVALAFDEGDIPDLEALMSEARRRHSQTPATFVEGVIPDPY
jgi:hypothetical protein